MSWAYINAGALSTSPTVGIAYPTGLSPNDILVAAVADSSAFKTLTLSDAGFASIVGDNNETSIKLWWKLASGSETGNFTSSGGGSWGQCAHFTGGPSVLSGNVNNTQTGPDNNGSGTTVPWNSMNVTVPNCLIIGVGATYDNSNAISSAFDTPAPWTAAIGTTYVSYQAFGWFYAIQTIAANISSGQWSPSNSSAGLNTSAVLAALVPAAVIPPSTFSPPNVCSC
jgi:hypothetical protein